MKPLKYRTAALLLCLGLLCTAALAAKTGSLSIHLTDSRDDGVPGVEIGLFRVSDKDGALTDEFSGTGLSSADLLDEKHNPKNARTLLDYALEEGLTADMTTTDNRGKVSYPALEEGVYLVFGEKGDFAPYLVYIPTRIGSLTLYDVKSEPKIDEEDPDDPPGSTPTPTPGPSGQPEPTPTPEPSDPPGPTPTFGPSDPPGSSPSGEPDSGDIVQTGARVWPIYLLLGLGTISIAAGLTELYRGRNENE